MIVKLLPAQIPTLWESIKFCAVQANEIAEESTAAYLNQLLQSLLSDKTQCFIRLDDKRILIALMLTGIEIDKITEKSQFCIKCIYSFKKVIDSAWTTEYEFVKNFAKKANCDSIIFDTRNEEIMRLGRLVGFVETRRSFEFKLGGI